MKVRRPHKSRPYRVVAAKTRARILSGFCIITITASPAIAQQFYDPAKADPEDFASVKQVCTACHDTGRLMHSRPWSTWMQVLTDMSSYGAKGTDEQWDHISRFLLLNVTTLNVNTATVEEIGGVLQVDDDVAAAIVTRRDQRKISDIRDLQSIAHVTPDRLANVRGRLTF